MDPINQAAMDNLQRQTTALQKLTSNKQQLSTPLDPVSQYILTDWMYRSISVSPPNATDLQVGRNINPSTTDTFSLGSASLRWLNAYIKNATIANLNGIPLVKTYAGSVNHNGTIGTYNPFGWTSARSSGFAAGRYDITHNLGTTNYAVNCIAGGGDSSANLFCVLQYKGPNYFSIGCFDTTGSFADTSISFILAM
ncbi:MAG: hypothetical protein KGI71_05905 [Patescibacteria group bacterium]|nr:hypothetical protein [Patescibacteria group bacterium]